MYFYLQNNNYVLSIKVLLHRKNLKAYNLWNFQPVPVIILTSTMLKQLLFQTMKMAKV